MTNAAKPTLKEIIVPEGVGLSVTFSGATGQLIVNGQRFVFADNLLQPAANVNHDADLVDGLEQRVLKVGERLNDGTVILSVNQKMNISLRVPQEIFGGKAPYRQQQSVIREVNKKGLCGHKDWRGISIEEGEMLSRYWKTVAPAALQGRATPWFWAFMPQENMDALIRKGCETTLYRGNEIFSKDVAVIRSGPALV